MKCRAVALTLGLLIIGGGVNGCAEEVGRWTMNGRALDRKVLALQPGMSVEAVRAQLGEPSSEISLEEEEVLTYGEWRWRLVFITAERLESWTREYKSDDWPTDSKALDRKVLKLQLGTSIEDVREKLGKPEALQIYRNVPHKEESLWYLPWKLSFTDGKLEFRTKW